MGIFETHREAPPRTYTRAIEQARKKERDARPSFRIPPEPQDVRRYLEDTGRGKIFDIPPRERGPYVIEEQLLNDLSFAQMQGESTRLEEVRSLLLSLSRISERSMYLKDVLTTLDECRVEIEQKMEEMARYNPEDREIYEQRIEDLLHAKEAIRDVSKHGDDLESVLSFIEGEYRSRFDRVANAHGWRDRKKQKSAEDALERFRAVRDVAYTKHLYPFVTIPHAPKQKKGLRRRKAG